MKYKREKNYWQRDIPKWEYLKALLTEALILAGISYLFYGKWFYVLFLSPYLIRYIHSWEKQKIKKKQEEFRVQFSESIQSLAAALNVGYSVENGLREASSNLKKIYGKDSTIMKELSLMIRQLQMNVPTEKVLGDFAERTGEEHVQLFVSIFNMAKRSGGDTLEIIRNVVRQIGEKIEVEREIDTLMGAKKMELRIMSIIPFAMMAYLKISFPEFAKVLYGNPAGIAVMSLCLIIYLISYEIGKKMTEIEV